MKKIGENKIAYQRVGKGNTLFLVHGFPLDGSIWSEVIPLLEKDLDLIIPDLRGFGDSVSADESDSMDDYAADLAGLMDELGVQKASFAGHSMGGYVALAFAKKYPKRVNALALVSSQSPGDAPERRDGRYKTAQDVAEKGIGVVVDAMAPKFTADEKIQVLARVVMQRQPAPAIINALKAMAGREDLTNLVKDLDIPLVLIHGSADMLIPVERAREIKAINNSAHLVELSGAGHVPMLENPKGTADGLRLLMQK
jgi:pimeloyl-ACP methyl ester carboxylesterase